MVQQGLEQVVVATVDQRDSEILATQSFSGFQTAKTTADDDPMFAGKGLLAVIVGSGPRSGGYAIKPRFLIE